MDKEFLIGTDIGTSGTKSVLVDLSGKVLAASLVEYTILTPEALWAEQWPDVWLSASKETIRNVVSEAGADPAKVAGICISGLYGGSGIPCDSEMKAVRPCIIWMDRRASAETRWVQDKIGLDRLMSITGNGVDPYFGFTKMLWIKNNEPDNWKRIKCFLPPNAYVIYHLTGETAIDYSSAGNIGGIFDMKNRAWSGQLMEEMGIPGSFMPERLVDSSEVVGELTAEAGRELGLLPGTPVCAGAIDCISATLSAGVTEPGQHVAVIGTSINWGVIHDKTPSDSNFVSMPYLKDPKRLLYTYGGASTAGALPRWFRDNFAELERETAGRSGKGAYEILDAAAAGIAAGSEGLLILPYFMGERTPIWDSDARGTILGLTLSHTKHHIYRAILESVAYALRHIMEAFGPENAAGGECVLVGGVTNSALWKQIFADVTGMPIVCPKGSIEAPLGDALLAGIGAGVLRDHYVIKDWIDYDEKIMPDKKQHEIYSEYFTQYKELYPNIAANMKRLVNINGGIRD